MAEVTKLQLPHSYLFEPQLLADAQQPFPVIGNYYVPLQVSKNVATFCTIEPKIKKLGADVLRFSLERPFAFARLVEQTGKCQSDISQRIGSLTLAPSSHIKGGWSLEVTTGLPLNVQDEYLFAMGVETYARYAANRLVDMGLLS